MEQSHVICRALNCPLTELSHVKSIFQFGINNVPVPFSMVKVFFVFNIVYVSRN